MKVHICTRVVDRSLRPGCGSAQVSKLNSTPGATVNGIIKDVGWVGLFTRGLPLRVVMIGTLTGAQWGIYDAYKVYVGL